MRADCVFFNDVSLSLSSLVKYTYKIFYGESVRRKEYRKYIL